jgi:hypothetical protein
MSLYLVEAACYLGGASSSSVAVGAGSRTFVMAAGAPLPIGGGSMTLRYEKADDPATYVEGVVVDVDDATRAVVLDVTATGGTGTHAAWTASVGLMRFTTATGYITKPGDTPPHVRYEPRVVQAIEIRREAYDRGATLGGSRMEFGDLTLVNIDGALDRVLDYGLDGRRVTVRIATQDAPDPDYPGDFTTLLVGTLHRPLATWQALILRVRSRSADIDKPLLTDRYDGSNVLPAGLEGTADDIEGRVKPRGYGVVREAPVPAVNTSRLIYDLGPGVASVQAVYDRGAALTAGSAYGSIADMEATAPSAGSYRAFVDAAGRSYVRLGSDPFGLVTADFTCGATSADRTVAQVAKAIVTGPGGIDPADVSSADVAALDAAAAGPVGLWIDSDRDIPGVLDDLCGSAGAWWGFDHLGAFRIRQLVAPAGTPAFTFVKGSRDEPIGTSTGDILGMELLGQQDGDGGLPVYRVSVEWGPCWAARSSDIADVVTQARRAFLAEPYRTTAPAVDAAVLTKHPKAAELTLRTMYAQQADAEAERDRQLALRKVRRDRLLIRTRLTCACTAAVDLGSVVLVCAPRFGFAGGRLMVVVGHRYDAADRHIDLTLWG